MFGRATTADSDSGPAGLHASETNLTQAHATTRQAALCPSDGFAVEPAIRVGQMEGLVDVAQHLSLARNLERVMQIVRRAGRELTGADGATFVLRLARSEATESRCHPCNKCMAYMYTGAARCPEREADEGCHLPAQHGAGRTSG